MTRKKKDRVKAKKRTLRLKIIIPIIVVVAVIILLSAVFFLFQREDESDTEEEQLKQEITELQEEFGDEAGMTVEENDPPQDPKSAEANISEIPGYIQKAGSDTENSNMAGMTFPYQIPDSSLQIL